MLNQQKKMHVTAIRKQLHLLKELSHKPLATTKDTVGRYLKGLESKNYVTSELEESHRYIAAKYYRITSTGYQRLQKENDAKQKQSSVVKETRPPPTADSTRSRIANWKTKLEKGEESARNSLIRDLLAALIDQEIAFDDQPLTPDGTFKTLIGFWEDTFPKPPSLSLLRKIWKYWVEQGVIKLDSEGDLVTSIKYKSEHLEDAADIIYYIATSSVGGDDAEVDADSSVV